MEVCVNNDEVFVAEVDIVWPPIVDPVLAANVDDTVTLVTAVVTTDTEATVIAETAPTFATVDAVAVDSLEQVFLTNE